MRNFITTYRIPLLLVLFLSTIHFYGKDLSNPYQKPITGDAEGYYAYLPALFIYHDLDYDFRKTIEAKYYIPGSGKSYVKEVNGEKVNKTFPGVSILYAPFFFIAHGIALISGLEADGYSFIYQLFFDFGFWFYFLLGMIFTLKILDRLNVEKKIANWSLAVVVLSTNIIFYSIYDISVTHVYNFFLINAGIYYLLRYRDEQVYKYVLLSLFFISLSIISRPTNILVLFIILIIFPNALFYRSLIHDFLKPKNVFLTFLVCFLIFSIPPILWKLQTGSWIVYSYGEEGFNFSNPQVSSFLFSFMKGWFVYTPIALIIVLFGTVFYFLHNERKKAILILLFYSIAIYVFSSWWCWYYGAGMGQRVMIDFSLLLIILASSLINWLRSRTGLKYFGLAAVFLFICLNFAQAWQIKEGILPNGAPTKEGYWDNFLRFKKQARVYPYNHWRLIQTVPLIPPHFEDQTEHTGNNLLKVDATHNYSRVLKLQDFYSQKGDKIVVSFEAKSLSPVELTRLVFKLNATDLPVEYVFFLKTYVQEGQWTKMEFLIEPDQESRGEIHCFFWNGKSDENVEIQNLELIQYHTDEYY